LFQPVRKFGAIELSSTTQRSKALRIPVERTLEADYSGRVDETFSSLSEIAFRITGTKWNGPRFFGLRPNAKREGKPFGPSDASLPETSAERKPRDAKADR
jgi:hypothetical protein